ncbi:MAG TPA: BatD family protein [Cellvibrio sp.]|nr:BatD family protein [Cellvibrio sp.]
MLSKTTTKHIIIRGLFLLGLLWLTASTSAGELTASVNRDSISLNETLTLTISSDGGGKDSPDFSSLKNDFDVLSNQRSSSIQVINGRTQASTDWQLTLAPKRAGTLLIPSFNVGKSVTDAIEITVSQQQNQVQTDSGGDEPVRAILSVSKNSAFVQEQIIVTVKLITQINLSQAELQPLEINNALVVNLDQQQYQTTINGTAHLVVETSFAIFPQASGSLIVPSLTYTAAPESRNIFGRRNSNDILRLRTEEQQIQVKPIPPQSAGKIWQPANQLTLNEAWSGNLDALKVGEPITRTIIINSDGLTAGQLAPINTPPMDGLTFYPDQAQTKDSKTAKGVQGTRTETLAIVPNRGGDFILPEVSVNWWNNTTQSLETATLPAKTLHVLGDASTNTLSPAASNPAAAPVQADKTQQPASDNNTSAIAPWVMAICGVFAALCIAMAYYIYRLKVSMNRLHQEQEARDQLQLQKEKDIWDLLKRTAAGKDAAALRKAVISWGQLQWPAEKIHTLDDIAKLGNQEALTEELKQLDRVLYSNHHNPEWDASNLLKLLNEQRKQKKTGKSSPELKNLYRE